MRNLLGKRLYVIIIFQVNTQAVHHVLILFVLILFWCNFRKAQLKQHSELSWGLRLTGKCKSLHQSAQLLLYRCFTVAAGSLCQLVWAAAKCFVFLFQSQAIDQRSGPLPRSMHVSYRRHTPAGALRLPCRTSKDVPEFRILVTALKSPASL